jgi:hypothetical protein
MPDTTVKYSIKYYTDPSARQRDPQKAINALYDLVEMLSGEIDDLRTRLTYLEEQRK